MVRDEGALRFVSMDEEEEEKRLKIIQAILHQILSPQQLPRSQASSVTPSNITLDQGSSFLRWPSVFQILISPVHPKFSVPAQDCRPPSPLQTTWLKKDLGEPIQVPAQRSHCFGIWANCHQEGNQSSTFSLPLDAISEEKGYFWCKDSNSCRRVGIETRQTCTRYNTHHSSSAIRSHPIRQLVSEIQKAKKVIFKVQRWKAGKTRSTPKTRVPHCCDWKYISLTHFDCILIRIIYLLQSGKWYIQSFLFYSSQYSCLLDTDYRMIWIRGLVFKERGLKINARLNSSSEKYSNTEVVFAEKEVFWSALHWSNQPTWLFPEYNLQCPETWLNVF